MIVLHDVDLLPSDDLSPYYTTIPIQPCHIAKRWGRYNNNPKYFGGIVAFSMEHFRSINGFPNNFWGWGGEDDEMMKRITRVKYTNIPLSSYISHHTTDTYDHDDCF